MSANFLDRAEQKRRTIEIFIQEFGSKTRAFRAAWQYTRVSGKVIGTRQFYVGRSIG